MKKGFSIIMAFVTVMTMLFSGVTFADDTNENTENIIEYRKKIDENRKKEHNSRNTKEQTMKSKNSLPALFYFMNEKEGN